MLGSSLCSKIITGRVMDLEQDPEDQIEDGQERSYREREGGPGLEKGESCESSGSLGALCGSGRREEVRGEQVHRPEHLRLVP